MSAFGPVASVYDSLMSAIPYESWADYYQLLLAQQEIQPTRVLDVCCGTGTLCEILTDRGFAMTGFDLSPGMIEQARRKATRHGMNIPYHVADARTVQLGERFEAAYSFFDSLNYITDPDGLRMAVLRVADHLVPGGSFVFDLNTAYAFEARLFDMRDKRHHVPVRYEWKGHYNPDTRLIRVEMDFWAGGEKFHEVHRQRAHADEEVRTYLSEAGFTDVRAFHSYTLDPPRPKSDRIHYACVRG